MKITVPHKNGAINYCPTCHAPVASTELDPLRDAIRCIERQSSAWHARNLAELVRTAFAAPGGLLDD